jgi:2-dehydro-3-deoxygalactonokinase
MTSTLAEFEFKRPQLIGLDWGTSSLRAYLLGKNGACLAQASGAFGILNVAAADFDPVYLRLCAGWQREYGPLPVLASGMIGSRQGWLEAPYVPCPATPVQIAASLVSLQASDGARIHIVPGLSCRSAQGMPDVMRGEETQLLGVIETGGDALWVLPGTHSKWARSSSGGIEGFATYMTGELYALLRAHSILGRLMPDDADAAPQADPAAFQRGVSCGLSAAADLARKLFSVRTLGLFGEIAPEALADYLSGLLLGAEIRDALAQSPTAAEIGLIGEPELCERYRWALEIAGVRARTHSADATQRGLWRVAVHASLV